MRHSAENFHPNPYGLQKQTNKKSFISENAKIWLYNRHNQTLRSNTSANLKQNLKIFQGMNQEPKGC
jgi:hypothetical protein